MSARQDNTASTDQLDRAAGNAIAVFGIFFLVGPPLGALISLGIMSPVGEGLWGSGETLSILLIVLWFSYAGGGVQAAIVGVVAAISVYVNRRRRISLISVLLASFVTGAASIAFILSRRLPSITEILSFAVLLVPHVGAGIGCWLIGNLVLRRSRHLGG